VIRVVLDTNILISALFFGGTPRNVVDLAASGRFQALTSVPLLAELEAVLAENFGLPYERVDQAITDVLSFAMIAPELPELDADIRDPKDVKVLACGVAGEADHIVTGDQDLFSLNGWQGISILTPDAFLQLLSAEP